MGSGTTSSAGYYKSLVSHVRTIGTESCGSSDASDTNGTIFIYTINGKVENISLAQKGQLGPAQVGINVGGHCSVENVTIQTNNDAASTFAIGSVFVGSPDGIYFKNVNVVGKGDGSGGPLWALYPGANPWFEAGGGTYTLRGASFEGCNFDSALTLANLPPFPCSTSIQTGPASNFIMWCSDSTSATPGTVMSAYATATAGTTNPSTTLTFAATTGIPSVVVNGWGILNVSRQVCFSAGVTVSGAPNYAAGTLTSSAAPLSTHPIVTGDVIAFTAPGGGTKKVPMRWYGVNGIGWVVAA